jgi:hypothetical protein
MTKQKLTQYRANNKKVNADLEHSLHLVTWKMRHRIHRTVPNVYGGV